MPNAKHTDVKVVINLLTIYQFFVYRFFSQSIEYKSKGSVTTIIS